MKFAPPSVAAAGPRRRLRRDELRSVLRDVTTLKQCRDCGLPLGGGHVLFVEQGGTVHGSGLTSCGSIWACPVCAAKIRAGRADEISRGVYAAFQAGGGALFGSLTLPHEADDALRRSFGLVGSAYRGAITGTGAYSVERDVFGIRGTIVAKEVTYTPPPLGHGWHPHLHLILILLATLTTEQVLELQAAWQARWDRYLIRQGWPPSREGIGVRLDLVRRDEQAVAAYLAKLQEDGLTEPGGRIGNEMTRADLKQARKGRVPFDILAAVGTDGDLDDVALWHEFEQATKGKSAIRWSKGLRRDLLGNERELTDEELAAEDVGGLPIAGMETWLFRRLVRLIPGGYARVCDALERGGFPALVGLLTTLRLDPQGVFLPAVAEEG